ncbi:MAG: methyltransferase domain-containing protein [Silicimonas sp.]|nr:methyltransferase domain-containing protein [Silicimonas sp.]
MTKSDEVRQLITRGVLVAPASRSRLTPEGESRIVSEDGSAFPVVHGVPILVENPDEIESYSKQSELMNDGYTEEALEKKQNPLRLFFNKLFKSTFINPDVDETLERAFDGISADAVCLSVGGGPVRYHPRLLNMNISTFPNVDIVGDAHLLPFANDSVDVVHSDAVFEHLHTPWVAAAEIARTLKPGGRAFIHTPFLQPYHGFPHHYQNFTITGHKLLFEREGLKVLKAGVGVGPSFVFRKLGVGYMNAYLPKPLALLLKIPWFILTRLLAPLDIWLNRRENAHFYASTTFVLVEKPRAEG